MSESLTKGQSSSVFGQVHMVQLSAVCDAPALLLHRVLHPQAAQPESSGRLRSFAAVEL